MPRLVPALVAALGITATGLRAAPGAPAAPLPFHLPTPSGWRTETLPFPLSFAPSLSHHGLEELRFAPGMFREGAEDFWTYTFVWVLEDATPLAPDRLAADLATYFDGLAAAVRGSKGLEAPVPPATCRLRGVPGAAHAVGTAAVLDAFATQLPVHLNLRVGALEPPPGFGAALYFQLSPQPFSHPLWRTMDSLGRGYRPTPEGT